MFFMNKRILFVAPHRLGRNPGQRFRFEQYIPYLQANGFDCEISNLLSQQDDAIFYQKGHYIAKLYIYFKCIFIRLRDVLRCKSFNIVFIYREALFTRSNIFERLFCRLNKHVFVDFDDAIFLLDISRANKRLHWLKNPQKINKTLEKCSLAIVGNEYLAAYARQYGHDVRIFPTTLDLSTIHIYPQQKNLDKICIGWIGSTTTIKHLEWAEPILRAIYKIYGDKVFFKVVADVPLKMENLPIVNVTWTKERESYELSSFDIGIMPLPDNEWTRGKCGFKGLQCMAYEIPVVMSPVGVNMDIIQDGENGFLADMVTEWVEKVSLLIDNAEMRTLMGKNGRKTVEEHYSYQALKDTYLSYFNEFCLC